MKKTMRVTMLGLLAITGLMISATPAFAGARWSVNIGVPGYYPPPVYYNPPPVYYAPPPVYARPPVVVYGGPGYYPPAYYGRPGYWRERGWQGHRWHDRRWRR